MTDLSTVQTVFVWLLVSCGVGVAGWIGVVMAYLKGRQDAEADLLDAFEDDPIAFDLHFTQQLIERLKDRAETLGEASASPNANPEPVRGRHL